MLRSPGLPSQRASSQRPTSTPPRMISARTPTPDHARAMLGGTLVSGRPTGMSPQPISPLLIAVSIRWSPGPVAPRSEEHTSELQSRPHLVCRLLLEKKKKHEPAQFTHKKKNKEKKKKQNQNKN